jgi:hypothetical protein
LQRESCGERGRTATHLCRFHRFWTPGQAAKDEGLVVRGQGYHWRSRGRGYDGRQQSRGSGGGFKGRRVMRWRQKMEETKAKRTTRDGQTRPRRRISWCRKLDGFWGRSRAFLRAWAFLAICCGGPAFSCGAEQTTLIPPARLGYIVRCRSPCLRNPPKSALSPGASLTLASACRRLYDAARLAQGPRRRARYRR